MSVTTHPMPIPGTSEAPKFDGHYLSDFLEDLEQHFARAGVADEDRQVNYITRYSTDKIRKQIGFLPELDRSKKNKTWAAAKTVLTEFYGEVDKPRPLSLAEFQAWVQAAADKPAFVSKDQVNKYYSDFMSKGQPLLDNKFVSQADLNFAFIQGVPSSMKAALRSVIPEAQRTRANSPTIKDTLVHLRGLANKDDPTYEGWRYEATSKEDTLVAELPPADEPSDGTTIQTAATSGTQPAKSSAKVEDQMEELMKQFSELRIMFAQAQSNAPPPRPQRCAMCAVTNPGHTMRSCPEAIKLQAEGRIYLDTGRNRFMVKADNSELPRVPYGFEGGIAAYLRIQYPNPPAAHAANTHGVGLILANGAVFSTLTTPYAAQSDPTLTNPYIAEAIPALRGGKEYENRFDPKKRPADKPSARQRNNPVPKPQPPPTHVPAPTPQNQPPPPPAPVQLAPPLPPTIPAPPHPINRKDGWKQSQPKAKRPDEDPDVDMRDSTPKGKAKPSAPSSGYKHATDLEQQTAARSVFDAMLQDVKVTLPLGQVLGTSGVLQELLHEATRRRRVHKDEAPPVLNAHVAAVLHFDATGVPIVQAEYSTGSPLRDCILVNDDGGQLTQEQLAFSTFALSRARSLPTIRDRMLAMATGVFTTRVNGLPFRCMVDSGSELNIVCRSFPDVTKLPLDSLGEAWQLQGIHGAAETLAGYIDSVPFQIGRHVFTHHVFVSPHATIGTSFDIILGQPFLTYFDARVDYSASGETVLYLWADRDKEHGQRPTLGISITDPEDARNRLAILAQINALSAQQDALDDELDETDGSDNNLSSPVLSAYVEDVDDESDYSDVGF